MVDLYPIPTCISDNKCINHTCTQFIDILYDNIEVFPDSVLINFFTSYKEYNGCIDRIDKEKLCKILNRNDHLPQEVFSYFLKDLTLYSLIPKLTSIQSYPYILDASIDLIIALIFEFNIGLSQHTYNNLLEKSDKSKGIFQYIFKTYESFIPNDENMLKLMVTDTNVFLKYQKKKNKQFDIKFLDMFIDSPESDTELFTTLYNNSSNKKNKSCMIDSTRFKKLITKNNPEIINIVLDSGYVPDQEEFTLLSTNSIKIDYSKYPNLKIDPPFVIQCLVNNIKIYDFTYSEEHLQEAITQKISVKYMRKILKHVTPQQKHIELASSIRNNSHVIKLLKEYGLEVNDTCLKNALLANNTGYKKIIQN